LEISLDSREEIRDKKTKKAISYKTETNKCQKVILYREYNEEINNKGIF
jgi:hypothetical protein